mmetsp:Transcript_2971/g.6414  ORF Transcript_2971/g.6414 Transcript_2971/m.6414 type:complete len:144 (+) Transcript_2971:344-775(+)
MLPGGTKKRNERAADEMRRNETKRHEATRRVTQSRCDPIPSSTEHVTQQQGRKEWNDAARHGGIDRTEQRTTCPYSTVHTSQLVRSLVCSAGIGIRARRNEKTPSDAHVLVDDEEPDNKCWSALIVCHTCGIATTHPMKQLVK